MRAAAIENGKVVNVIEVDNLNILPNLVDGASGNIGDSWDGEQFSASPPPPESTAVPQQVTMRQARLALLAAGKLDQVDAVINALPDDKKGVARIEWDYSSAVERGWPLVAALGQSLGLGDAALDQLFITAAGL